MGGCFPFQRRVRHLQEVSEPAFPGCGGRREGEGRGGPGLAGQGRAGQGRTNEGRLNEGRQP